MLPLRLTPNEGRLSVLCLGAHADDIEIGAGGLLMRLAGEHADMLVTWVVLSADGERAREAEASARGLLPHPVRLKLVLGQFEDALLPAMYADAKAFLRDVHRAVAPDLILTHHLADAHQDHRAVSELTWQLWRDHLVLEYEVPKYEGDLGRPNLFVPLARAVADRKVDHLMTHFGTQGSKDWFTPDTFHGLMALRGIECRAPEQRAEAFHARKVLI